MPMLCRAVPMSCRATPHGFRGAFALTLVTQRHTTDIIIHVHTIMYYTRGWQACIHELHVPDYRDEEGRCVSAAELKDVLLVSQPCRPSQPASQPPSHLVSERTSEPASHLGRLLLTRRLLLPLLPAFGVCLCDVVNVVVCRGRRIWRVYSESIRFDVSITPSALPSVRLLLLRSLQITRYR